MKYDDSSEAHQHVARSNHTVFTCVVKRGRVGTGSNNGRVAAGRKRRGMARSTLNEE